MIDRKMIYGKSLLAPATVSPTSSFEDEDGLFEYPLLFTAVVGLVSPVETALLLCLLLPGINLCCVKVETSIT